MTSTMTLLSFACAIANSGVTDTSNFTAQLNDAEKAQVQLHIEGGACLPQNMEFLLKSTRERVSDGTLDMDGVMFREAPSDLCT